MAQRFLSPPVRIAGIYLLAASAWILLSDTLLRLTALEFSGVDTLKGMLFVGVTTAGLYAYLRREFDLRFRLEASFSALIQASPLGIISFDPAGRVELWNLAAEEIFGWNEAEVLGRDLPFVREQDRHEFEGLKRRVAAGETFKGVEIQRQRKDGTPIELSLSAGPRYDAKGTYVGVVGIVENITERKEAEAALRASEQALLVQNAILHESRDFIALGSLDGEIVFVNEAGALMLEAEHPEMVIGLQAARLHPPEAVERLVNEYLPHALQHGYWRGENHVKTLTGRILDVNQTLFPIRNAAGEVIHMATIMVDITVRKRMENALRESELRFRQIAENMREVFYLNDVDGRQILYVSPAYEKIWGQSRENLYRDPAQFFETIHPDDRRKVIESVERHFRGEQVEVVHRVVRPDHTIRWVRSRAFPVYDEAGTFHRVAGIAEDITEQVRYENQLKRLSQRLMTVLDNERARIARELHDQVGQQLTGLGLNLAVVQAQCSPDHPSFAVLEDSADLISSIIECLRLIIADLRPLVLDDMGLAAGLRWYCEKFTRRTSIPVTLTLPPEQTALTPTIDNTFYQIAQEALMNIAKHAGATQVWITLAFDDKQVTMTIRDDGRGFDAAAVLGGSSAGSWGLKIMQERIRGLVGAYLWIESAPGEGTQVRVEVQL